MCTLTGCWFVDVVEDTRSALFDEGLPKVDDFNPGLNQNDMMNYEWDEGRSTSGFTTVIGGENDPSRLENPSDLYRPSIPNLWDGLKGASTVEIEDNLNGLLDEKELYDLKNNAVPFGVLMRDVCGGINNRVGVYVMSTYIPTVDAQTENGMWSIGALSANIGEEVDDIGFLASIRAAVSMNSGMWLSTSTGSGKPKTEFLSYYTTYVSDGETKYRMGTQYRIDSETDNLIDAYMGNSKEWIFGGGNAGFSVRMLRTGADKVSLGSYTFKISGGLTSYMSSLALAMKGSSKTWRDYENYYLLNSLSKYDNKISTYKFYNVGGVSTTYGVKVFVRISDYPETLANTSKRGRDAVVMFLVYNEADLLSGSEYKEGLETFIDYMTEWYNGYTSKYLMGGF
jgi:hypothetical protein